jgi:siroheme synthase-like protein
VDVRADRETSRGEAAPGQEEYPALYPIAVKLELRSCLVVGGGAIALHKTRELLRCGALVHAVALEWLADFSEIGAHPRLTQSTRPFRSEDLNGAFLTIAATDDAATQLAVARGAEERGILCNVVDVNALCNFYAPAILRRGSLTVAVSTAGKSPLFAAAIRDRVGKLLGPHLGPTLDRLGESRARVRDQFPDDPARRRQSLDGLLTHQIFEELMEGRLDLFEAHWESWKKSLLD